MAGTLPIEWEPRTLNFQEIQLARETALYVMNTKSMEEALRIFTKGLKPVTDLQERSHTEVQETGAESEESDFDEDGEESYINSLFFISHEFKDVSTSPL